MNIDTGKIKFNKSKLLIYLLAVLIISFIGLQMYVLTSVGVQGKKISDIKLEKQNLQVENEILNAEIQKLQSRQYVLSSLENQELVNGEVQYLNEGDSRSAQSLP